MTEAAINEGDVAGSKFVLSMLSVRAKNADLRTPANIILPLVGIGMPMQFS